MRLAVLIVALLGSIAAPAVADSIPTHPGQSNTLAVTFQTKAAPETIRSTRFAPSSRATIQAGASFNGHIPQSCWADTMQQFECAWRGVIVIVQIHKHAAPMIVRVASARHDSVKVRLSLTW